MQTSSGWSPASGTGNRFYYVNSAGYLTSAAASGGKPVTVRKLGPGYTKIVVSADGTYLAALQGTTLYTGPIDGSLTKRGSGYVTMSWDANDDLWASQGTQTYMFRGAANPRMLNSAQNDQQALSQKVPVDVVPITALLDEPITALQIAPDGVRVAIVVGGDELTFGAISRPSGRHPQDHALHESRSSRPRSTTSPR